MSHHTDSGHDFLAPRLLKPKQVQEILSIGNTLFYELVNEGKLPLVRIGRASFVDSRSINRFIDSLQPATPKVNA
jgi:predicted DNA-binding transcriptional regulator AlpA